MLGRAVGEIDGIFDGTFVGVILGVNDGIVDGCTDGRPLVGVIDVCANQFLDGMDVGPALGDEDDIIEGGVNVGMKDGFVDGVKKDGIALGDELSSSLISSWYTKLILLPWDLMGLQ